MDAIVSGRAVVSDRATSTNPQASSEAARPTRFARFAMRIVGPVVMVAIFGMWMRMDRARTVYVNNQDNGRSLHIPAGDVLRIALIMDLGQAHTASRRTILDCSNRAAQPSPTRTSPPACRRVRYFISPP